MQKKTLKIIRDKMVNDTWEKEKNEWEMKDIAYLFNLSTPRIYKILKKADQNN